MAIDLIALQAIEDAKTLATSEIDTHTDASVTQLATATEGYKQEVEDVKTEVELIIQGDPEGGNAISVGGKTRAEFDAEIEANTEQIQILSDLYIEQVDFVDEISKFKKYDEMKIKRKDDEIIINYFAKNKGIAYTVLKNEDDDFWKLSKGYVGTIEEATGENIDAILYGTFSGTSNAYTTTVGDSFTVEVTGEVLYFDTLTGDTGGIWEFTIDGDTENKIQLSNYAESLVYATQKIGTFTDGLHTVYAEFIGDDPLNPPNGGISRGWLKVADTIQSKVVEVSEDSLILVDSNKEFAISGTKDGTTNWIPAHNGIGSSFEIEPTVFVVDDVENDLEYYVYAENSFSIVQNNYCKVGEIEVGELNMISSFRSDGTVGINGTINVTSDFIASGYLGMFPISETKMDEIITSTGDSVDLGGTEGTLYFDNAYDKTYSFLGKGVADSDVVCAFTIINPYKTFAKGLNVRNPNVDEFVYVWDRVTNPKLYCNSLASSSLIIGDELNFSMEFGILESKNIAKQF